MILAKKLKFTACSRLLLSAGIFLSGCGNIKKKKKNKWESLFNGKDINNWTVKINHHDVGVNYANTFRVEDGIIKVRYDQYGPFNEQYGHLYYNKPYSHYKPRFQYRITGEWKKDAAAYTIRNSGVM